MDSILETELILLITQLLFVGWYSSWYSKAASVITQIIYSVSSTMDLSSEPKPESEFMSLITLSISLFYSMDLDSQPKPLLSEFISRLSKKISLGYWNTKWDSDLMDLYDKISTIEVEPELMSVIHKIFSLVISINSKSGKFISLCPQVRVTLESNEKFQVIEDAEWSGNVKWKCFPERWVDIRITGESAFYFACLGCNGKNHEEYKMAPVKIKHHLHRTHSLQLVLVDEDNNKKCHCCDDDLERVFYCCLPCRFAINMACVKRPPILSKDHRNWHENTLALFPGHASLPCNLCALADSSYPYESELISLITQLMFLEVGSTKSALTWKEMLLITQIISLTSSMDLDSQLMPQSDLMSLITQTIAVFNSMDLDSQLSEFISLLFDSISLSTSLYRRLIDLGELLFEKILTMDSEPELISFIHKILSLVISMNSKSGMFIFLCPNVQVELKNGKVHVCEEVYWSSDTKWGCLPRYWKKVKFTEEDTTCYFCDGCNGKNHEEYKKAPVGIKHHLHRKHSLQLVLLDEDSKTSRCYCCDDGLERVFYCCLPCDFAINMACVKKPPVLTIDSSKWHEHTLALFPRHTSLTCNLCALSDASSPIYMCPNCDFVVHLRCVKLPRVIRISRHHHRVSFTPSFDQKDWCCGVCRRKINDDYGGYSCIKEDCFYTAHSRCATQSNVWDGKELEGEPEEEIEENQPFVGISDGIIHHFTHPHHHLRLDENMDRDYDDNKQCQACHTPIYIGNFYSCMQCDFLLHEECANFSCKIYHPIHPHPLTLRQYADETQSAIECEACTTLYPTYIYYQCVEEGCFFKLHVKCATIAEPLVHESHNMHLLFLTSKPEEDQRICTVCNELFAFEKETFNCIECDFSLCFRCATLPQKVRYKHDNHMLTLSYGDETSTMTYWCEVCEGIVNPKDRFYVCDEYCCVTLHIECLLGRDLYMKPTQSSVFIGCKEVNILPNNHHMSRPICSNCEKRCPHKTVFKLFGSILCSLDCISKCRVEEGYWTP